MIATPQPSHFTPDAYLQLEENGPLKHEYIDGRIYAMVGVSDAHNTVAGNLVALLHGHLRGSGCRLYFSHMKARIETLNRFYYPDLMVTCDERDRAEAYYKRFPCLLVEVLSDSTEAFDRGDKFEDYQTLESLREYVLISSKRQLVQCFRLNDEGLWVLRAFAPAQGTFEFQSINFSGSLEALYEGVSFPS